MKGANTAAAVKKAEKKKCTACGAKPGNPCTVSRARFMTRAALEQGFARTSKPHAARLRAAGVIK